MRCFYFLTLQTDSSSRVFCSINDSPETWETALVSKMWYYFSLWGFDCPHHCRDFGGFPFFRSFTDWTFEVCSTGLLSGVIGSLLFIKVLRHDSIPSLLYSFFSVGWSRKLHLDPIKCSFSLFPLLAAQGKILDALTIPCSFFLSK